jgi:hypothetical protein
MKIYKLYLAKPLLVFDLLMLAAVVLAGVILTILAAAGRFGADGPPAVAFLVMLVVALFTAYMWLRVPFEIKVRDDGIIEFRSLLRSVAVSPGEIMSVRAKRYALGFIDVVHSRGTVHMLSQMDGLHEFITTLKSVNPAVKIQGC